MFDKKNWGIKELSISPIQTNIKWKSYYLFETKNVHFSIFSLITSFKHSSQYLVVTNAKKKYITGKPTNSLFCSQSKR